MGPATSSYAPQQRIRCGAAPAPTTPKSLSLCFAASLGNETEPNEKHVEGLESRLATLGLNLLRKVARPLTNLNQTFDCVRGR